MLEGSTRVRAARGIMLALALAPQLVFADEAPLGPGLGERVAEHERVVRARPAPMPSGRRAPLDPDDLEIEVVIESRTGAAASVSSAGVAARGGQITAVSPRWLRVRIPLSRVRELARHPDVAVLRLPRRPISTAVGSGSRVSESVELTGADVLQAAGLDGTGIDVAIIDLGFSGWAQAQAAGELGPDLVLTDWVGSGIEGQTIHGAVVAEQIADIAPGARLHLVRIDDEVDLDNAVNALGAAGVDIVNMSLAWFGSSYYDGTGDISDLVNQSRTNDDIVWSVAAGNFRLKHWRGLNPAEAPGGWLYFTPVSTRIEFSVTSAEICLSLEWNQFGSVSTNLDLFLFADGSQVQSSVGSHASGLATEGLCRNWNPAEEPYTVGVRRVSGPPVEDVSVFSLFNNLVSNYRVADTSMADPAVADGAMAVTAIDHAAWGLNPPPLDNFASAGPTTDGRIKPEFAAPNRTQAFTQTIATGTSFAAPVVAGLAALVMHDDPLLDATAVEAALVAFAEDVGDPGKDTTYGHGLSAIDFLAPLPNTDGDAIPDAYDNCVYAANSSQDDVGGFGGPGADGVGDACQCGDGNGDGSVEPADASAVRAQLTGTAPLAMPALCNVFGPADGGVADCDVVDWVVHARALALLVPGVGQVCAPALP